MITTEHGEALDIATVVTTWLNRNAHRPFKSLTDELYRLENMLLWLEDVQFISDVYGMNVSFNWSVYTTNRLFAAAAAVHKSLFSPTVDWQNISFNAATGKGCCDQKLVIICSRYGMRENSVSCVTIKKLVLQFDTTTFFPDSKHRAISFNTGTVGVGGMGKTNLVPTAEYQENEILPRRGSIIDAREVFVMYFCFFVGALLHLLPQRSITEGGGQISVLFQSLPVPAALQSLLVMNISLALSAAYGALLVRGNNSGTLKSFYTYFSVIFVAAAGGILAYAFICLSCS